MKKLNLYKRLKKDSDKANQLRNILSAFENVRTQLSDDFYHGFERDNFDDMIDLFSEMLLKERKIKEK